MNKLGMAPIASFACLIALSGCAKSCRDDKPHVPFRIDTSSSGAPSGIGPARGAPSGSGDVAFQPVPASRAPENTSRLDADGSTLTAPDGHQLRWVIRGDFDGDGVADLAAWSDGGGKGELLCAKGTGPGKLGPSRLCATHAAGANAECALDSELSQVGPRTLLVAASPRCADAADTTHSPRWYAVASLSLQPSPRLELVIDQGPLGESLRVQVDGIDLDGDQYDDLRVALALSGEPAPFEAAGAPVNAELRFFDRPAGLSRDPKEPESSLRAEAQRISKLARKKGALAEVASAVRRLRRLYLMLCAEGASPLVKANGMTISCGASSALQDADLSELDAAIRAGDMVSALAVLERIDVQGSAFDGKKLADARAKVEKALGTQAAQAQPIEASVSLGPPRAASWGALAFEPDGSLLVRGASSVMRVDVTTRAVSPAVAPADTPWSSAVLSPEGTRVLQRAYDPCDGTPVRAQILESGTGVTSTVPLPVQSLVGRACATYPNGPASRIRTLAWGPHGPEMLVDGVPIAVDLSSGKAAPAALPPTQPAVKGSPRSPDGQTTVLVTSLGPVTIGGGKVVLWKVAGLREMPGALRDCAVANGAVAVACVDGGKPVLITLSKP